MNLDKTNKWLSLLANFGLIAGLFLVAFEIQISTEIAQRDLSARAWELNSQQQSSMFGENPSIPWQKAHKSPKELTADELMTIYFLLDYRWDQFEYLSTFTRLDSPTSRTSLDWHAINFFGANEITRAWWRSKEYLPEWAKYVDERIPTSDSTEYVRFLHTVCESDPEITACEDTGTLVHMQ